MEEGHFPLELCVESNDQETRYYGISSSKFILQRGH
jgi:hypothetical protein